MREEEISAEVRDFIAAHIRSVAQLETLLLLKTNPSQRWTAEMLARELRIDKRAASEQLGDLERHGLLIQETSATPQFRYNPATPAVDAIVVALAQAYLVRRVTVIGLIFSGTSSGIRAFSDAFRIRRDPENG